MSRLQKTFQLLGSAKKKAYIGYAMAGFPDQGHDLAMARGILEESDVLELGVPFSDPIADGVVLQRAGEQALTHGGGLKRALELARSLRQSSDKPILLMSYLNPLLAMGLEGFRPRGQGRGRRRRGGPGPAARGGRTASPKCLQAGRPGHGLFWWRPPARPSA